jgi:hypothetical protein
MEPIEVYCNRIKAEGTTLSTSQLKAQWHELNNAETETETETTKTKKPKK